MSNSENNSQRSNEEKKFKLLSPKIDVVFQALFGEVGNERITKKFLENIMNRKIESIDLNQNPILRRELKDDKIGVLDIIAKLDNKENCNVEMQIIDKKNIVERILFYWSKLYIRSIKRGIDYDKLEKTIVILITDFEIKSLKEVPGLSKWQLREETNRAQILTEKLELYIIQLPRKGNIKNEELKEWLSFIENPKDMEVIEAMKKIEELKEAGEKLNKISEDEKMQRIAELREKAIMDEKAIYARGVDVGKEEGIKQGIEQGKEQGQKDKQREIAKKMLKEKIDIGIIIKVTGLSGEELKKINS
jgi:predicted transposase/invertase (TIGR01784 family)